MRWSAGDRRPVARLFCFSYAGGGAAAFRLWPRSLGSAIETLAIQLPGRANRIQEPPLSSIPEIVDKLHLELLPVLDKPFAFFGHSMGAVVAAELCRSLALQGNPAPVHLFVSGRRPPGMAGLETPLRHLSDEAFVAEIDRRYGGIPPEVASDPDILSLLIPALRADVTALETHRPPIRSPMASPITAFGGTDDLLSPRSHLDAWARETRGEFAVKTFAGGHFYLESCWQSVVAEIVRTLSVRLDRPLA
jgi:medium-chain acyl-[acyl-carrier-protein] hydrolase